ncbi:MAG TPA: DUF4912 domain-containing protein [Candidatus Eisenbacteria bacterium]
MSTERLLARRPAPSEPPPAAWRGRRYDEDRLHLLVRDPRRVFAAWEISRATAEAASASAARAGAPVRYALRIERAARAGDEAAESLRVDLPDAQGGEGWYVELPRGGGWARAVIGIDLPGGFEPLLASRWMPVPPDGPCAEAGSWPADESARAWLERDAERKRGQSVPRLPTSSTRYLASPPARGR